MSSAPALDDPLAAARQVLADRRAWLVGGALRDRLLGRHTDDLDLAVEGDPRDPARRLARAVHGAAFPLNESFGGWRVVGPGHAWQVDLVPLRDDDLDADLDARDFTINALAEPIEGGAIVDRHGGERDLRERRLRMVGPTAFEDDPLRVMRLARHAVELDLDVEPQTAAAARAAAPALDRVSPERVFAELKRTLATPRPQLGLALLDQLGALRAWLPELESLKGVDQSRFHAFDVWDHTLDVLGHVAALPDVPELLAQPFADEMTRGTALRLAALLHDIAKPQTRDVTSDGFVTFLEHHREGADVARAILRRLRASEKLVAHVAAIVRWHLRAGTLFYAPVPPDRRAIFRYLRDTGPVAADVALLALCDRRGNDTEEDLAEYHALCRLLLQHALEPLEPPLVRGNEVAEALGRPPGPWLGEVLEQLAEDRYAGEISTREEALARAAELVGLSGPSTRRT